MKNIKTLGMVAVVTAILSTSALASKDLTDSQLNPVKAHGICVHTIGGISACCDLDFKFSSGSATLLSYNNFCLHEVVSNVKGAASVSVTGHTDNVGNDEFNMRLSKKRAETVSGLLRNLGVNNIKINGSGEIHPVASNETEKGRAKNRRVEIN